MWKSGKLYSAPPGLIVQFDLVEFAAPTEKND